MVDHMVPSLHDSIQIPGLTLFYDEEMRELSTLWAPFEKEMSSCSFEGPQDWECICLYETRLTDGILCPLLYLVL